MAETTIWQLAAFIEERIAEDERLAHAASHGPWAGLNGFQITGPDGHEVATAFALTDRRQAATAAHIAQHDPHQVLTDSAAKRALVDLCLHTLANPDPDSPDTAGRLASAALRALASPYARHPDYDERWRL